MYGTIFAQRCAAEHGARAIPFVAVWERGIHSARFAETHDSRTEVRSPLGHWIGLCVEIHFYAASLKKELNVVFSRWLLRFLHFSTVRQLSSRPVFMLIFEVFLRFIELEVAVQ